jgi:YD repeat-containing protein
MLITATGGKPLPPRKDCRASSARHFSERLRILIVVVAAFAWLCGSLQFVIEIHAGGSEIGYGSPKTPYVYDELGRPVQVVSSDLGLSATYYDAVGNPLSITVNTARRRRGGGPAVVISEIYPDEGTVGTQVTICGSGFRPTASSDSVTFNGTTATIGSGSANSIVATVPSGATTGQATVTSAERFRNQRRVIHSHGCRAGRTDDYRIQTSVGFVSFAHMLLVHRLESL